MGRINEKIEKYLGEVGEVGGETVWVLIKLEMDNKQYNYVALGFDSIEEAEEAAEKFEKWDNVKTFSIDLLGVANEKHVKSDYRPLRFYEDPKVNREFIREVYDFLMDVYS